jgi:hypothetical protein
MVKRLSVVVAACVLQGAWSRAEGMGGGGDPAATTVSNRVGRLLASATNTADSSAWIRDSVAVEGELVKDRDALDAELRRIVTEERMYRESALKQDEKLRRFRQRIAELEAELEAMTLEKHPRLVELRKQRQTISARYEHVARDLATLRGARVVLATGGEKEKKDR